jgi:hypothetical protein
MVPPYPTFAGFPTFRARIAPLSRLEKGESRLAPSKGHGWAGDNGEPLKRARLTGVKAHLHCHGKPNLLPLAPHAGAGGARSVATSDRISWNICRDTAISAILNVT